MWVCVWVWVGMCLGVSVGIGIWVVVGVDGGMWVRVWSVARLRQDHQLARGGLHFHLAVGGVADDNALAPGVGSRLVDRHPGFCLGSHEAWAAHFLHLASHQSTRHRPPRQFEKTLRNLVSLTWA